MSDEWTAQQEKRFSEEPGISVEALANQIQRERIDVAVKFIGGPGLRVLDVGCADGTISELIHGNGNECWGMDLPAVVDVVPKERREWLVCFPGDASREPWPNVPVEPDVFNDSTGFFDVVFAGEIIEHMIDIEPFLTEAWRVLKPGGRLVLTTPNAVRSLNRIAMLLGEVSTWHEWEHVPHHVRYFTPRTLAEAAIKYGFKPLRQGYGRSQAEGGELGFDASWVEKLSPEERKVLLGLFSKVKPEWRHSFIILESERVERRGERKF